MVDMDFTQIHAAIDVLAKCIEILGVFFILLGIFLATTAYIRTGRRLGNWSDPFRAFRTNMARGILLGLEMLVGADIISTITAPLTGDSVLLLGGIVLIRTFLSFSLETEIEGCWPWQRARLERRVGDAQNPEN